ncbi:MAG: hypothetical protein M1353_00795 [Nitrospirae bacterium]|nr:hypothetical protein [Nitrospirota bacterium]
MFRSLPLTLIVAAASLLAFGRISDATTLDEAEAQVEKQATEKRLTVKEKTEAITVLQNLVAKDVPVGHAYRVVEAGIDQGIKSKALAGIARSIESVEPKARGDAAFVAKCTISNKYNIRDTVSLMAIFKQSVKAGIQSERVSEVMTRSINKGLNGNSIMIIMERYAVHVKSGMSSERAMERASIPAEMTGGGMGSSLGIGYGREWIKSPAGMGENGS